MVMDTNFVINALLGVVALIVIVLVFVALYKTNSYLSAIGTQQVTSPATNATEISDLTATSLVWGLVDGSQAVNLKALWADKLAWLRYAFLGFLVLAILAGVSMYLSFGVSTTVVYAVVQLTVALLIGYLAYSAGGVESQLSDFAVVPTNAMFACAVRAAVVVLGLHCVAALALAAYAIFYASRQKKVDALADKALGQVDGKGRDAMSSPVGAARGFWKQNIGGSTH